MAVKTQEYWENRQEEYGSDHPHREVVRNVLSRYDSVFEFGCGYGHNLKGLKNISGCDINPLAIKSLQKKGNFKVGSFLDYADVILFDGVLLYIEVEKLLNEAKNLAEHILIVDLHSDSEEIEEDYLVRDYRKLLKKLGFKNIKLKKIPKKDWNVFPWTKYGYYIQADA